MIGKRKRNKSYSEICQLIKEEKIDENCRNHKGGISIHEFEEEAKKRGHTTDFYLNGKERNSDGKRSISFYQIIDIIHPTTGKIIKDGVHLVYLPKHKCFCAEFDTFSLGKEEEEAFKIAVKNSDLDDSISTDGKWRVKCKNIEDFFRVVDFIADIPELVKKTSGAIRIATQLWPLENEDSDPFEATVALYRVLIEKKSQIHLNMYRFLLGADVQDQRLLRGHSVEYLKLCNNKNNNQSFWREHVIPCVRIHNRIIELILSDATDKEIINFIKEHLIIVMITEEERILLDERLGLQTDMPEGWNWGDDIYSRLRHAKIEIVFNEQTSK